MALFSKIKKILQEQNACVLSKNGNPEYVVLRWDDFQKMKNEIEELKKIKNQVELEREDEDYDIDINKIPV
jgi:PHD/YefM family antitoxin component YafN of YafNO toxin-antitoxin module